MNGYAEHWRYINRATEGLRQLSLKPELACHEADLSKTDLWKPFGGAGTQYSAQAEFKVVASVVFQFGSARSGIELGPGKGVVDIADVRFQ